MAKPNAGVPDFAPITPPVEKVTQAPDLIGAAGNATSPAAQVSPKIDLSLGNNVAPAKTISASEVPDFSPVSNTVASDEIPDFSEVSDKPQPSVGQQNQPVKQPLPLQQTTANAEVVQSTPLDEHDGAPTRANDPIASPSTPSVPVATAIPAASDITANDITASAVPVAKLVEPAKDLPPTGTIPKPTVATPMNPNPDSSSGPSGKTDADSKLQIDVPDAVKITGDSDLASFLDQSGSSVPAAATPPVGVPSINLDDRPDVPPPSVNAGDPDFAQLMGLGGGAAPSNPTTGGSPVIVTDSGSSGKPKKPGAKKGGGLFGPKEKGQRFGVTAIF